jgi:hypothetical protein
MPVECADADQKSGGQDALHPVAVTGEPVDSAGSLVTLLRAATLELKFKKQIHPNKIKVNNVINYIYKLLHPQTASKTLKIKNNKNQYLK